MSYFMFLFLFDIFLVEKKLILREVTIASIPSMSVNINKIGQA